jgi:hypothetical protein
MQGFPAWFNTFDSFTWIQGLSYFISVDKVVQGFFLSGSIRLNLTSKIKSVSEI